MPEVPLDAAGRRRSPATMPGFHTGRPPRNGQRYPADPPNIEEIVAVMLESGDDLHGRRLRGVIAVVGNWPSKSTRRSRSPRPISIRAADRYSSSRQGRPPPPSRHGRVGPHALAAPADRGVLLRASCDVRRRIGRAIGSAS